MKIDKYFWLPFVFLLSSGVAAWIAADLNSSPHQVWFAIYSFFTGLVSSFALVVWFFDAYIEGED